MLPNFLPQYSPQGLMAHFGVPGAALPYLSPALFGQPGVYGLNGSIAYPAGPGVVMQPPFMVGTAGAQHPAQQIVLLLGQLAQQISVQGGVSQHISAGLLHLAHQLLAYQQLAQGQPFIGAGQPLGLGTPFIASQYLTPNVFAGVPQGGFAFTPPFSPQQAQAWGVSRPQTIQ
jgi:hypothetical protein